MSEFSLVFMPKDNPAFVPSGYGKIAQYVTPRLIDAGYDTRLFCSVGHNMSIVTWKEPRSGKVIDIWPGSGSPYGEEFIPLHLQQIQRETSKPPILLFCGDVPAINQLPAWSAKREVLACAWGAVDWEAPTPKHAVDKWASFLHAWPMSQHGDAVLKQDGLQNALPSVWCGVDMDVWQPRGRDPKLMSEMGFSESGFNVFSCFANQHFRKGEFEMFAAIGEFHRRHPEAKIHFYALTQSRREWDFPALIDYFGMRDLVTLSDDYKHVMGGFEEETVARMMDQADCVLSLGYEGFGLQTIEAQALNKPVIGFGMGATPELLGSRGVLVPPEKELVLPSLFRKPLPSTQGTLDALEYVYRNRNDARWRRGRDWAKHNATWDHCTANLVRRLKTVEQRILDDELGGPMEPGPRAKEAFQRTIQVAPA